jgi:DNA-binding LytR/AlgR family response regulator
MLNIAICDDDTGQSALLAGYTSEFIQAGQYDAVIHQFNHPDDLLNACERLQYHIYILDIIMPMVNGIEVGKAIREHDREARIIYATSEPSFALQSFVTNPTNYLVKPIDKQQLFTTLALMIPKLEASLERTFTVKTHEGIRILRFSEILCCEYSGHAVRYTLTDGTKITTRIIQGSFTRHIARLMEDGRFLRPHVSYVLNMDHVESFGKNRFTLRFGTIVPIVARQYRAVRDTYMDYLLAKERS